jgi:aspartate/methionine/tyrosine aminotransferase
MRLEPFEMERLQSTWENRVRYNLSESGVHPMSLGELVEPEVLRDLPLGYPQTNGSVELRERISDLYPGSDAEQIIVTTGTAEANFICILSLIEPGDEAVVMLPNYMQIWGLAGSLGAVVRSFPLRDDRLRWAPDLDQLAQAVNERTRLIAVCNPNNPTGAVLSEDEIREICDLGGRVGAWILADEVYKGAELGDDSSPSFWGRYDRVLVTCGLSKAYGLPGLRIGWVAGPGQKISQLWSYKDYTTVGPGALSERLATVALEPQRRLEILERTRTILKTQFPLLEAWVKGLGEPFHMIPPQAGAIAYLRYDWDINSTRLIDRLREEKSVLLVPGDHFHMDHHVRIGYGGEPETLQKGLALVSELLDTVRSLTP